MLESIRGPTPRGGKTLFFLGGGGGAFYTKSD
eukprot:COSAG06_NODE_58880_length_275_cov_0.209040_1_plen_31_part_10